MADTAPRMPPFPGLLAFDAALRHGSMTIAADELGLTQSAVSHRIRALEGFFGVKLLQRLNPGLRATEAGARLWRDLVPLLGSIGGLRRRIAGPAGGRTFRLGLGAPLLAWWLSPRLVALGAAFPDLSIDVVTWDSAAEAAQSEVDLALLWLPHAACLGGASELRFPQERVFPVAAPRLLRTLPSRPEWQALPLLAKGRRGEETGPEWSWPAWLGAKASAREALRFRDIGSSLQAAVDGNGVALARSLLAADALARRRLVQLVRPDEARPCSKVQLARWNGPADQTAAEMAAWLVAAVGMSVRR